MNSRRPASVLTLVFCMIFLCVPSFAGSAPVFSPDDSFVDDRAALERLQRDSFRYMWEFADPVSGMVREANYEWDVMPVAVGATGFGVAALVAAADREWISREEALTRLFTITRFLRDKTPRKELHGAFPHWLNGSTGAVIKFGDRDAGADIVETALLMQGLLIARSWFNGPGNEAELRAIITELWEDVDWNWFTAGQENGLFWHWGPEHGHSGLKILGNNECLIAYVLALASPTHPISRAAYDYWTSGNGGKSGSGYLPKTLYGYTIEAALPGAGPLFLTHYSFIGLDPRRMADSFVPGGYFARNVKHVLSNRGYCLYDAPKRNRYGENFWGLSAGHSKNGYVAAEPAKDSGTISPTAALSSMPYTPHYAMQVLEFFLEGSASGEDAPKGSDAALLKTLWGPYGPYDGISLRDKWVGGQYLGIDQLPMACMVENYRSGLLWNLFMADADVRAGLEKAGITGPHFSAGFPEAAVTVVKQGKRYAPDAYDIRRHPDSGLYAIPYWVEQAGPVSLTFSDAAGVVRMALAEYAGAGRNYCSFPQFMERDGSVLTLTLTTA
ncbi:hypothetical protein LJC23_03670, partial [Desulfovibrio sp. OttesenSCG-928-I05]|nr:hypothetical protein [Desulfovibrio sp. OttesenSCG-928-I05]